MNRRTFLLGLGVMGCSGTRAGKTKKKRMPRPTLNPDRPITDSGHVNVDLSWFKSQYGASPLAFHGNLRLVFQSMDGEILGWNATTMQRTDRWVIPHRHFCVVQGGSLVIYGDPMNDSTRQIHRISNGSVDSLQAPILPIGGANVVLPGSNPDNVYLTVQNYIYLLRLSRGSVTIEAILEHPAPNSATRDQWVSRGDGRIIGIDAGYAVRVLAPGTSTQYAAPARHVIHLVAGTRDQIWYSYIGSADESWNIHTIVLAEITSPTTAIRKLDVAPVRAIHMASHGDLLAVLLFRAIAPKQVERNVALFDENGRERWRTTVPDDFLPGPGISNAFIGLGEHTVVVASRDRLVGWSVATGKRLG